MIEDRGSDRDRTTVRRAGRDLPSQGDRRASWQKMPQVIEMIDAARAEGLDVTADMCPYVANGTGLTSVLPPWAEADGKLYENLADPETRARIGRSAEAARRLEAMAGRAGPEGVMPVGFEREENRKYAGMRLTEIQDRSGRRRLGRDRVRAPPLGAAADRHDLFLDEREKTSSNSSNSPGSRSRLTREASTPPGPKPMARPIRGLTAPTPASSGNTSGKRLC
ncbi:MAG: hypothetical protein R3A46_10805 [Thermomicrobiales bacterium]